MRPSSRLSPWRKPMKGKQPRKAQRLYSSLCFSAEHFLCHRTKFPMTREASNNHTCHEVSYTHIHFHSRLHIYYLFHTFHFLSEKSFQNVSYPHHSLHTFCCYIFYIFSSYFPLNCENQHFEYALSIFLISNRSSCLLRKTTPSLIAYTI